MIIPPFFKNLLASKTYSHEFWGKLIIILLKDCFLFKKRVESLITGFIFPFNLFLEILFFSDSIACLFISTEITLQNEFAAQ